MLNKLRKRAGDESGFTLIELLVVILIIGILAAIALPSFLGQRTKAQDTEAKTAARTAQTAIETFYTDSQTYVATAAQLTALEPALSEGAAASLSVTNATATNYTVTVRSATGNDFSVSKVGGSVTRPCTNTETRGGCGTDLVW